jgi:DNA-binding beta-propeller fold protein YncE
VWRVRFLCALVAAIGLTSATGAADRAPPNLSVAATIPGPDGNWDYAAIDTDARRLYVAHGDAVIAVDIDTGVLNPRLIGGDHLHAVLPLPGGRVLSTNGGADNATLFEGATGREVARIPTGGRPDGAFFDPSSGLAILIDAASSDVTLIDPATAAAVGKIAIGDSLEFGAADGHGRAYINIDDKGQVAVLDVAARKVVARYALPDCEEPSGMAIDRDTGILISACRNGVAIALRSGDGAVLARLTIGEHPDAVMFDTIRKLFFIPCGAGSLAVIAEGQGAPAVVETVPTAAGARTGALDARTGRIYLPTADFTAPAPGAKRGALIPGTFRILVVGEK